MNDSDESNSKESEIFSSDNKSNDIDFKKGKSKGRFEKESKGSNCDKRKSLLGELKHNIKEVKSENKNKIMKGIRFN